MTQDLMNYNQMVEQALRGVVRQALQRVAEDGLPAEHHFYIGFRTDDPGVDIPEHLRARYPDEMTIVLQHQFWGLDVGEDAFSVSLSFNKRPEALRVPYSAISSFFDPAVQFGLQFKSGDGEAETTAEAAAGEEAEATPAEANEAGDGASAPGNIVTLDSFRRK